MAPDSPPPNAPKPVSEFSTGAASAIIAPGPTGTRRFPRLPSQMCKDQARDDRLVSLCVSLDPLTMLLG